MKLTMQYNLVGTGEAVRGKCILVIVTGFRSMISIACLHHWFCKCNLVHILFEMILTCVPNDFVRRRFVTEK